MFETIVALATPPMKSALAIIRVSGDDCFAIVSKCFSKDITEIKERTLLVGYIEDKNRNQKIDEVVVAVYKGPRSFTGEDLVEIICHGSMLISQQIIDILIANGARLATNGEYSSRAFIHQKIDLIQAEAINDIINSSTKESKDLSMLSLTGKTSELLLPVKTRLADIISLIEVNIDYPEYEDIEQANKQQVITICEEIINMINKLVDEGEKARIIKDGIKVAIVGKPNVGKSSLFNTLLNVERAIVTDIAGTTRDVLKETLDWDIAITLIDTAGIRDNAEKIEEIGIEYSKQSADEADLVLFLYDASIGMKDDDKAIFDYIKNKNHIIIANKADLLSDKNIEQNRDAILLSTVTNQGLDELKSKIKEQAYNFSPDDTEFITNNRQQDCLKKCRESLNLALDAAKCNQLQDLISIDVKSALLCLDEITGEVITDDILNNIFDHFCIGK